MHHSGLRVMRTSSHLILTVDNDVGAESTEQSPFKNLHKCHTTHKGNSHDLNSGVSAQP